MHLEHAAEFRFQQTKLSVRTVGKAYTILPPCRSNFENSASQHDNTLHTVKVHTWLNKKQRPARHGSTGTLKCSPHSVCTAVELLHHKQAR